MRSACPLLVLLLVGCGGHEDPPAAPEPAPEPAAEPAPAQAPAAGDDDAAEVPSIRELVRRGRVAFRAQDYTRAARDLEAALAQNPDDGGLACETGWAFHHAGDDVTAHRHLILGTRILSARPDRRRSYGACLYNLGRIAEDAGHRDVAAAHYTNSLRARPNGVVQQRLDALEVALAATRPLYDTREAALDASEGFDPGSADVEDNYISDVTTRDWDGVATPPVLAVSTLSFTDGGAWNCYFWRLTVQLEGGWVAPAPLGDACGSTEAGSYDDGHFTIESIEPVPGAAHPTLAVLVEASNLDCSLDDEGSEQDCTQTRGTRLVFVALVAGALEHVVELPLAAWEQQEGEDDPVGYGAEAEVGDGRVTVRVVDGTPPRWMLGTHTLDQLITAAP